jgi:hypothetical protein
MLADDRAQAFVSRFFFPWLELDKLGKSDPDKKYFPDYDVSLRDSLAKETELFLLSQLRDDRDPIELWSANYTFINEQLAKHYDIPNIIADIRARSSGAFASPDRAGLLGQGSLLMVTLRHQHGVDAAYTTPATRAKWVRIHFLGVPPPNPFPGAQPVKPELPITGQVRALPADPCVTCHRNFFPLGYALENFDPLGRWRTSRPSRSGGRFGRVRGRHVVQRSSRTPPGPAAAPRHISYNDYRKTAGLLFRRIGRSLDRDAGNPHSGATDSAQHPSAPVVRSNCGHRADAIEVATRNLL